MAAVGAGGGEGQAVEETFDVSVAVEGLARDASRSTAQQLAAQAAAVSATGSEPRVPQKRTPFMAGPRRAPSAW